MLQAAKKLALQFWDMADLLAPHLFFFFFFIDAVKTLVTIVLGLALFFCFGLIFLHR